MTQLVGILNVTPDSFSDGGRYQETAAALEQADRLFADGAALVDVGAESTRPGAQPLTPAEEQRRLHAILPELLTKYPGQISLDTYHPQTAEWALGLGQVIINDVSGMTNPAMLEMVSAYRASCIVSQLPDNDIQRAHQGDLLDDIQVVKDDLLAKAALLETRGIKQADIILDPGIGFGKTPELNKHLLRFAELVPNYQVMVGYSRKRFLGEHRLELAPNLAAGRIAIAAGTAYIRVHDVAGHRQLLAA